MKKIGKYLLFTIVGIALFIIVNFLVQLDSLLGISDLIRVRLECKVARDGNICGSSNEGADADIFAIPADRFNSLVLQIQSQRREDYKPYLPRLFLVLTSEQFETFVVAFTTADKRGMYSLTVPPGDYLLCLANMDIWRPKEMSPTDHLVIGCVEASVQKGERLVENIDFYRGLVM